MSEIEFRNDKTRAFEKMEGSDGRANVSSRSDSRAYYNSRDEKQAYSVCYDHQSAVAGEYSLYIENTSSTKELVISAIGINAAENARVKLVFVSGVASGSVLTPTNLNKGSSNDSDSIVIEGVVTGLTEISCIDFAGVQANGHEQFRLNDVVRLGQNDAIAIKYDEGTTGDLFGVVFMMFE
jgi:hypothetical protein